ncbi:hypothetical protein BAUCODRAFT_230055 [Baudoinia panamericana UAMH 10762]|uniref:Heme peroxidase n=1 Tax=Baudoinia panamericana (strain UAMH 10762) TaxID=717646 RepID=M2N397_BAUPA|nr:uncharacterized protein BAUCODRAFT_230055 [Baudoinia panamericana UAMH 10762]EMC93180.1 hypothetical protein BAUCODRAFT_230055 [Baudoinia panamericana UAMH 10762]
MPTMVDQADPVEHESWSFQLSFFENLIVSFFKFVNKHIEWHKLPTLLGVANLLAFRYELRAKNLYDGYASKAPQGTLAAEPLKDKRFLEARSSDGDYNSLEMPKMGCAGMRFGRNIPRSCAKKPSEQEMMTPNPRLISDTLMKRTEPDGFKPATTLNLLAAAWIQFQVHDWFFHEQQTENDYQVPLPPGDDWPSKDGTMALPKSQPDVTLDASDVACPGYKNMCTPWWDASQLYGESEIVTSSLRSKHPDGKLELTQDKKESFLPRDPKTGLPLTGFNNNWWIGLELLHTLFALEHNAVCDLLRAAHPTWTSDQIFDKARLVISCLMAKIHTVEWTPAILAHPALQVAMNTNWWGLVGEKLTKLLGRLSTDDVVSGIPGSGVDQDGVPYSLTEEFVSVYRMHTLIPDNIAFFNATTGSHERTTPFEDVVFAKARDPLDSGVSFADAFYSFGINYPGAITHNNYGAFLRGPMDAGDGVLRDMATVDILRDRERGIPRYCEMRRLLHMTAPKSFLELTGGDEALAKKVEEVYEGDVEKVDLLIGCHCEPLPKGFGFSDTAFRVFILMASRRLKSDRFIANQFDKETYTAEGLHWVQNTTMKDVLIRHFPELAPTLKHQKNVFAPWPQKEASKTYKGPETNAPAPAPTLVAGKK